MHKLEGDGVLHVFELAWISVRRWRQTELIVGVVPLLKKLPTTFTRAGFELQYSGCKYIPRARDSLLPGHEMCNFKHLGPVCLMQQMKDLDHALLKKSAPPACSNEFMKNNFRGWRLFSNILFVYGRFKKTRISCL